VKRLPGCADEDQAPRERLLAKGPDALSDRELVAILLRTGGRESGVLGLADRLLEGGLGRLALRDSDELLQIPGLGPAKVTSLQAAFELGRRAASAGEESPAFDRPETVYAYLRWRFPLNREELRAFFLDGALRLVAEEILSRGGAAWTHVAPADVFAPALRRGARAVVLAHNHPGGDSQPSETDRRTTRRLEDAGVLLGIELVDHIVISQRDFYSFRRHALLGRRRKEPKRP